MNKFNRTFRIVVLFIFMLGLFGPAPSGPALSAAATRAHSLLIQEAAQNPGRVVGVIVQKRAASTAPEELVTRLGGRVTRNFSFINAFAAELPASAVLPLADRPEVRWVSPDGPVRKASADADTTCGLNTNHYLDTTGVRSVWDMGIKGSSKMGVAVIDSGIDTGPDLSGLKERFVFNPNSRSKGDFQGHGTHVAGIIAGSGMTSKGKYEGVAPGVSLYSLKVSDENGQAYESGVVDALQWVYKNRVKYNIRVVNLSLNSSVEQSYKNSPMDAAAEILWFDGVVVVVSSGNTGTSYNTINSAPANDPFVITVGAANENCSTDPADDSMASFSQFGVTQDGISKPDLLAPGYNIVSLLSDHSNWDAQYPERVVDGGYFRLSGTSMAAPVVTGSVALLLQHEPGLTPDQVKYRLTHASGQISYTVPGVETARIYPYLNTYLAVTSTTTQSANTGLMPADLLWTGSDPVNSSVSWNSVSWNSVSWNSVSWNSVSWNSVSWNSVSWNSEYWGD